MTPEYSNELSDDEYLFTLANSSRKVLVIINGPEVPIIIDSGATVNVVDSSSFALLSNKSPIRLEPSRVRVYPYGARVPLPVKGSCTISVSSESSKKSTHPEFVVALNLESGCLLGRKTEIELNLLRVGPPTLNAAIICMSPPTSVDRILSKHSAVFEGIGELTGYQLLVHTDASVAPVAQPLWRTPFHVRKVIEKKRKSSKTLT